MNVVSVILEGNEFAPSLVRECIVPRNCFSSFSTEKYSSVLEYKSPPETFANLGRVVRLYKFLDKFLFLNASGIPHELFFFHISFAIHFK